jgi:SAM-dependent methyltransferase
MSLARVEDKVEILGLELFETHQEEMGLIKLFTKHFGCPLGWHYYLDLAWIIRQVRALPQGALLLDAGAGGGILQFILAELGYNIISADFSSRFWGGKYAKRYGNVLHYLNSQNRTFENRYTRHLKATYSGKSSRLHGIIELIKGLSKVDPVSLIEKNRFTPDREPFVPLEGDALRSCGRIFMYKCDLKEMPLLPDGFVDAVVSVSALEHNDHVDFEKCVDEILRVTKPFGRLFMTVSASLSEDWFHEPSKGWCYSEETLKRLFRLPKEVKSNFAVKDEFFMELRKAGNELHKRLDDLYFKSGDNGMPWGKWAPKYQPVGVVKQKK